MLQIEFLMLNDLKYILIPYNILLYRNQRSAEFLPLNYNNIIIREKFSLYLYRPIFHYNRESRY
jgi:hypothetical protein